MADGRWPMADGEWAEDRRRTAVQWGSSLLRPSAIGHRHRETMPIATKRPKVPIMRKGPGCRSIPGVWMRRPARGDTDDGADDSQGQAEPGAAGRPATARRAG